jgi:hypothetical protein
MRIKGNIKRSGRITVVVYNLDGTVKGRRIFRNMITDAELNAQRDYLAGTVTDGKIKYLAWGSGATAVNPGQTQLVAEVGRKAITTLDASVTKVLTATTYVSPAEANFHIKELGWFAGAAASMTPDSGRLAARVLYDHDKTELESLQVEREDTLQEG